MISPIMKRVANRIGDDTVDVAIPKSMLPVIWGEFVKLDLAEGLPESFSSHDELYILLQLAVDYCSLNCVKRLIAMGADINHDMFNDEYLLSRAIQSRLHLCFQKRRTKITINFDPIR